MGDFGGHWGVFLVKRRIVDPAVLIAKLFF